MPLILSSLAAVSYGFADFLGGRITRRTGATAAVLWTQIAALAVGLVAAPLLGGTATVGDFLWGGAAGIAGTVGVIALYRGLASGRSAVVAPLAALVGGSLPMAYGLVFGDALGLAASVGVVLALPAIYLTAGGVVGETSGFRFGVLAGVAFGLFFVLLINASAESGIWPLVAAKTSSILVLAGLPAVRGIPDRRALGGLAVAGVGDMAANAFFLIAVRLGPVAVVAVVVSMFPAVTVALFRIFDAEPIARRQWVGVALAVSALALFAL